MPLAAAVKDTFEFLLQDTVLKGISDHHLVGGNGDIAPATDMMHELGVLNAVSEDTEYLVATIRLFACLGTPTYLAAVITVVRVGTKQ